MLLVEAAHWNLRVTSGSFTLGLTTCSEGSVPLEGTTSKISQGRQNREGDCW